MLDQITPLILTYNEAPNIGRSLADLSWASDIVVLDSFSDDETLEIVSSFPHVRLYQREFDSHANQWNFGLKRTGIESEWVLALDADYVITKDFLTELKTLRASPDIKGYRAKFVYCINGKRLTSGIYPPVTVLYRRGDASYFQDGHTHKLNLGHDSLGLLWIPRNTNPVYYQWYGDKRWFTEYHWHGLALIAGNAYVLAGLALFGLLGALALLLPHRTKEHDDEPGARTQTSLRGRLRLPAA